MSYKTVMVGNVFLLRWEHYESGDSLRVVKDVTDASRRVPGKVNYVAIIPPHVESPPEAQRREMADGLKQLLAVARTIRIVIMERGFRGAAVRTIAAGLFLLQGQRGRVSPYETLPEALANCEELTVSLETIMATARARGLIE
jgi:hypothetical protein